MAYLNGNHVPNLLRPRTLASKLVGTVCSVAAGLPMGPEGPMVHVGACVASAITYAQCTCLRTGRWLSCFGRRPLRPREQRLLERMRVLDDIVSDSGAFWGGGCERRVLKAAAKENPQTHLFTNPANQTKPNKDHREFVSAGAAAGISAAFGAPVGGVLFAMEEACSFWCAIEGGGVF
jgi:chloride channel 7